MESVLRWKVYIWEYIPVTRFVWEVSHNYAGPDSILTSYFLTDCVAPVKGKEQVGMLRWPEANPGHCPNPGQLIPFRNLGSLTQSPVGCSVAWSPHSNPSPTQHWQLHPVDTSKASLPVIFHPATLTQHRHRALGHLHTAVTFTLWKKVLLQSKGLHCRNCLGFWV